MKTAFLVFFLSIGWVAVVNAQLLSEQFEYDDGSLITVSYTHLTLPTILLV